jgi:hypothetical protein
MSSRFVMPFADVGSGIKPASGAKLFFFEVDGVTPKDTFSDQLPAPTPNTNPVIADSKGVFSDIYIDGDYKVTLQDNNGSQIFGGALVEEFITRSGQANNVISRDSLVVAKADTSLKAGLEISVGGRNSKDDGGKSVWFAQSSLTGPAANGTYVVAHDSLALVLILRDTDGNALKYGAINGGPDSSAECNAAIEHVNRLLIPKNSTVFAREIELKDNTHLKVRGSLRHKASSPEWSRVLTNADRVNGNKNFTIDFTGGEAHGNQANQSDVNQHYFFFVNCSGVSWIGGTLRENKALRADASEITPTINHPDGPFEQGVVRGESVYTNPDSGLGYFIGGKNNHAYGGIKLINWQKEGFSMRWCETSSIGQIEGISGPEVDYSEYATVNHTTRSGSQAIAVGDHVLVQDGYEFNGEEQQPFLIYAALVSGSIDLGGEDYTDTGRWSLVTRDISLDYGYTVARITGVLVGQNAIYDGSGSFCRASTFSNDSEQCTMTNLRSYHNSFQVGINFGHASTPADGSVASNLIAINAGWAGGVGGNSYGINLVSNSQGVQVSNFYVCGAARNGVNQSDGGKNSYLSDGTVKFSGAGGVKSQSAVLTCNNVRSRNNVGDDFEAGGAGVIRLLDCEDSRRVNLYNERVILTARNEQPVQTIHGETGSFKRTLRNQFATSAGVPIATLNTLETPITDGMLVTLAYVERNPGSGSIANQWAAKATFLVIGSGTARSIEQLDAPYSKNRQFRAEWDTAGELRFFLQDNTPTDVAASPSPNSLYVEIQNTTVDYTVGIS